MDMFLDKNLFDVLPTVLVPAILVLAPIVYMVLSNRGKGEFAVFGTELAHFLFTAQFFDYPIS